MSAPRISGARLTDAQRLDWLRLIRSENVGPRTFRALVNRFGGAGAALAALPELVRSSAGARPIVLAAADACRREMDQMARAGARFIALGEPEYPAALRAIDAPPPLLAVKGDLEALARPMIAIVGSRNASAAGLRFTEGLAHDLAAQGYVIVSGLARGIDQMAHRASLRSGAVAVLAGGLDRIYPSEHRGLAEEICAAGALVSEMPFSWEPRGRDFPRRNRIVSGLALATVVIEAARRSGSLITARFANEQGRQVFAVPGSPLDPRAEGTNDLLRQGASLCARAEDVLDALAPVRQAGVSSMARIEEGSGPLPEAEPLWDETDWLGAPEVPRSMAGMEFDDTGAGPIQAQRPVGSSPLRHIVEALLGPAPVQVDDIVRASAASVSEVHAALLDLELEGRLQRHGGSMVSLTPSARGM